jgi:hypothetical protein
LLDFATYMKENQWHYLRSTRAATSVLLFGWMNAPPRRSISTPLSSTHPQTMLWDKALNYVFSRDRDFQDFLKTPQAKQLASTLRIRKGPSKDAAEQPAKKLTSGVESTGSVRVSKA